MVRLEYVENTGGFLGLGADWPDAVRMTLFRTGTGLVLLVMVGLAVRLHWHGRRLIGVWLVFAGGASNWVDRVARGSVVDFMNVGVGPLRTGIFNVAEVAIMVGAAVLLLDVFRTGDSPRMSGRSGHAAWEGLDPTLAPTAEDPRRFDAIELRSPQVSPMR
jgi:signal peptidase II